MAGDIYEYIGVYVDDLVIVARNPKEITNTLLGKYGFKLKGTYVPFRFILEWTSCEIQMV
jgi:hypothetical protein